MYAEFNVNEPKSSKNNFYASFAATSFHKHTSLLFSSKINLQFLLCKVRNWPPFSIHIFHIYIHPLTMMVKRVLKQNTKMLFLGSQIFGFAVIASLLFSLLLCVYFGHLFFLSFSFYSMYICMCRGKEKNKEDFMQVEDNPLNIIT